MDPIELAERHFTDATDDELMRLCELAIYELECRGAVAVGTVLLLQSVPKKGNCISEVN
jgi:hypothetical protein